jgi:hypothetical protein
MKDTVTYYLRGPIERGAGSKYVWKDGYSPDSAEGRVTYPWVTVSEARAQERTHGRGVRFVNKRAPSVSVDLPDPGPVTDEERSEAARQEAEDAEENYNP